MQAGRTEPLIAIVDDDPNMRDTLSALMRDSGFEAVCCADIPGFHALGDPPPSIWRLLTCGCAASPV